ncbi:hypothetical protein FCH28_37020 [Streptomyces piniterrae]|uniref:Uncharacterized protein n=1 Tax=Streptomyces piniterrae TaxID=2571125 RepID=A0A4U0MLC2_9ACTN|nr:hypothetical protein [Streptomyces piniterrae]TJZ41480.1 hypothetical protein FCH28_37020 [Streptomyces piniterrae]
MPESTPRARICRDCDGFDTVAITTGTRHHNGTRQTITVTCRACNGTGHTPSALALHRIGR